MNSKRHRNEILLFRWGSYCLMLFLAAILQSSPGFLNLWGVKPVFILPVCLAVAVQEENVDSAFFGMFGGLVWDFIAGRTVGLLAFALMIACFTVSVLIRFLFRVGPANFIAICMVAAFVICSMDFLFGYAMRGYSGAGQRYLTHVVPMLLLTGALSWVWLIPAGWISSYFVLE